MYHPTPSRQSSDRHKQRVVESAHTLKNKRYVITRESVIISNTFHSSTQFQQLPKPNFISRIINWNKDNLYVSKNSMLK